MFFNDFLSQLNHLKSAPIGGREAQFKLAPALRLGYDDEKIKARNPKKAAVLALFYPNSKNETCFLLTERASYQGTHSAQISFPGGKRDKNDSNLTETALRETYEEVGVSSKNITIIRELTDVFIPPSNFLATPFLAFSTKTPEFILNHEVASVVEVSLANLLDDKNIDTILMNTSYMDNVSVPCFKLNDFIVWGATGMMLSEIKELIKSISF